MITIRKSFGSYNWCKPSEKQWSVHFKINDFNLSAEWPEDEEPDIDGVPPSELIELFVERYKKYLFSSRSDEVKKAAEYIRENSEEIDREWANNEIAFYQKRIENLQDKINLLIKCYL